MSDQMGPADILGNPLYVGDTVAWGVREFDQGTMRIGKVINMDWTEKFTGGYWTLRVMADVSTGEWARLYNSFRPVNRDPDQVVRVVTP